MPIGSLAQGLEKGREPADTSFVRARASEEQGFGLVELVFAIFILNIGILALMGSFNSSSLSIRRAAATSNATAIADKAMEVYRDMRNCGIYLTGGTGNDASGLPNGIPNSTSSYYATYHSDTAAYSGGTYFSNASPSTTPLWVIDSTTGSGYTPIPASASTCIPSGLAIDPTKAVQLVTGPDGLAYPVLTYVVIVHPSGYAKQVTVDVYSPVSSSTLLARESTVFDPNVAP